MKAIVCSLAVVAAVLVPRQFSRGQTPEPSRDGRTLGQWIERDDAVCEKAAIAIGKLGPEARAVLLAKTLDDKLWYVHEVSTPSLVKMLGREEVTNRYAAARALSKIGPGSKASAAALAEAAFDYDGDVRDAAIKALVELRAGAKAAVPVLAKHLNHKKRLYWESRYALAALGKLAPAANEAIPEIAKLLKDSTLRNEAFVVLTDLGPVASPVLPQLVACWSGETREEHIPSRTESVKLICQWMNDGLPARRSDAERLWNVLGAEDLPSVAPLLTSESAADRALAIDKFYDLGEAAVPTLVELVKDSEPSTRRTAIRILGHIGPAAIAAVPALAATLKEKDSEDRSVAAISLGQIGSDSAPAVAALNDALTDPDSSIRVCSIEALGRIGPAAAPAIAGLIGRLHDTSPVIRSAAARALGQIGPVAKAALPELDKLRRDPEDYVRQAAEEAVKANCKVDSNKRR